VAGKYHKTVIPDRVMRVLIVAFCFPPANVIGAIRVGKLARYLDRLGHEVRVLSSETGEDRSLPLEIPAQSVIYTRYRARRDRLDSWLRPFRRPRTAPDDATDRAPARDRTTRTSLWNILRHHYYGLIGIPDLRRDWLKTAIPAGKRLIESWKPDLIFASAPPFTALIVADRLARAFGIPWIADYRDLWADNPYYSEPRWRRPLDAMLEWRTVRSAAALVTVSPNWADQLQRRHGKVTRVIYNGYAEEDFPQPPPPAEPGNVLTIRYTGSIYRGFRDPSALFAAIGLLNDSVRGRVVVEFFGDGTEDVLALAAMHHVKDYVAVRPRLPYRRALELQMQADVLLLLQWNDKRDEGNLPGKLFEYLFARRPILFIGYEEGIAAQLIRERGAGLVATTPARIRDQLQTWIEAKGGCRPLRLDPAVSHGLSRDEQFHKLELLFADTLQTGRGKDRPLDPTTHAGTHRQRHCALICF
jgi:hypothetical protein